MRTNVSAVIIICLVTMISMTLFPMEEDSPKRCDIKVHFATEYI